MKTLRESVCMAAALAAVMVFWSCKDKIEPGHSPSKEARLIQAPIAVVETGSTAEQYEAVATVTARVYADLAGRIMGVVQKVHVEEGDRVKEGDVLVVIDSRQATARLEQTQAALEEARGGEASAESAKIAARVSAELAETTYQRYQRLLKEESATQQEFDEMEARSRQAQAAFAQAEAMLAAARNRVQQAEAAVKAATVGEKDASIQAPYDGRITRKRVHAGDLASPGMPLLTIEKEGGYRAEAVLPEKYMKEMSLKQRVSVVIPALEPVPLEGVISQIIPGADPKSRSFRIRVDLPKHEGLRSGMFARVSMPLAASETVTIPKKAILRHGQLSGVFVLDEANIARFRLVRTGKEMEDAIEILSGLKKGMRYVADPPPTLEDGMKVEARS